MAQKRNAWQEALASFQRLTQGAGQAVQSFTNNPIGRSVVNTAMNSNPITQNFNVARQMAQPVLPLIRPQVQSFSQNIVPQMRPITQNVMNNPLVKTYTNLAQGYKTNLDNVRNTAGSFLSNNPNFATSPLGAALSGNWNQSGKSLVNLPKYYNQLEANKVKAWQSGDPRLQKQVVEGDVTAVLNTIGGPTGTVKTKIKKQLEPAVKNLRHLLSSREVYLLDEFTDAIRSGKGRGELGQLGRDVHAMTAEAFGRKAADTWSNKKIADAWQYVFKRLSEGRNSIGMGLSVNDVSDAFAKKGSSKLLGQKTLGAQTNLNSQTAEKLGKQLVQSNIANPSNQLDTLSTSLKSNVDQSQVINPSPSSLSQGVNSVKNTEALSPNRFQSPDTQMQSSNPSLEEAVQIPKMGQTQGSKQIMPLESPGEAINSSSRKIIPHGVDELVNKVKSRIDEIYTKSLDRFHPISKLGKQAGEDQAMRNALTGYYGAGSIGKYHTDFELSPILKSANPDDLRAYTIAQRDIELSGRDIQGSNKGDATKILDDLKQKYGGDLSQLDAAANKLYDYQKNLVKEYLVDTGIMSKDAFNGMTAQNQKYVPFKRVMDQVDEYLGVPQTKGAGSVASQNVIKGIKGSKRDIVDPLQSIIENTYKIVGLGKRQQVAQTIVGLKDSLPEGTIVPLRTAENVQKRIQVFTELKNLFADKRSAERGLRTANKGLRKISTKIRGTARELESLIDEASTRASEFEAPSKIQGILDKALTRERRIYSLEGELQAGASVKKAQELSSLINERKSSIQELRQQLAGIKDIKGVDPNTTISVFNNGIKETYKVPLEVADAAKGLSEEGMNTIVKILAYPTRLFRASATGLNPEFAIPNVARDLQSTFINNGLNPLKFVSGLAHYMKKDQVYQDFLKAGGMTSRISLDQPFLKQSVQDLAGQKRALRIIDPRRIKAVLEAVGQASEQPTRIASFESARNAALKKGLPDAAARGAYAAQEGSVNFARRGSQTQGFNAIYAFLNARAQGIDRLVRSAKTNPAGVGLRVGLVTAAPAIGLYAYNRNFKSYYDPRVVPDYVKQNNFVIMLGDKPIPAFGGAQYITIPKGDVGKLANPLESFMQYADSKGGDIQSSLLSVLQGFSPISNPGDIIPTALRPAIEDRANYSFFKGRDIVSESKKNYPAPYQTNKNTAAIYNQAGQLLNYSPAKLENLARGYLTGFARIGEQITQPFAKKDTYSGEDINQTPIIRRFMGGAQRSEEEQQQNDSYELKDLQKKIQDIRTGIKYGNIPEDAGLREIEKIQGQVETKVKQQSYFGVPEAGASNDITFTSSPDKSDIIPNTLDFTEEDSAPGTVSIADEIKIDNIKAQIKKTGQAQEYQGKVYYPNTNRDKILSIDLTTKLEDPQFTNNPTLDKEILSDYQGKITSKTNEIVKLTTLINSTTNKPYLTPDQAETLITGLKQKLANVKASQKTPTNFELTGDPVIDKSIRSRFQGQITTQINDVVDYVQEGKLTPEQGRDIINRLNARRGSLRGGSGGGRKKKVNYKGVKITAKPIKIPTLKLKLPKTKIPKYKPIKAIRVRYKS